METDMGKLFIGGISWDTNEERLRDYFKNYGEVLEAVIMKDRTTGRARGFGFIVFADPAVAERVVMEKHMIDGRMVEAKKAVPRDDQNTLHRSSISVHSSPGPARTKKIFVGGLASTVTQNDFRKYFEQFGTITDDIIIYDPNTQRPRGFGFITYDSEDAVDKALVKTFHELNGKMVEVKRAVPKDLSPGPNIRSPISGCPPVSGYSYGMNRVNNFLNGYTPGYNVNTFGSYGMRVDGRFGPLSGVRNGFPLSTSYGVGIGNDPAISPGYGGNSFYSNSAGIGRSLNPFYNGSSNRFTSPVGYAGASVNTDSVLNSMSRNVWGNNSLSFNTNSSSSNSYVPSASGGLGGIGHNTFMSRSGAPSPISSHSTGGGSYYASGALSYGNGENNFGFNVNSYGRGSSIGSGNNSFIASNMGYEGNNSDLYGGSSVYGDRTWRSGPTDLDNSDPFSYGLGNPSDTTAKGSSSFVGGYNVTNRQQNRGIVT